MNDEPKAMREIHEIQERIYEQEKHLSATERIANANRIADDMINKYSVRGKVSPKIDSKKN
jgi:hypothetical protein